LEGRRVRGWRLEKAHRFLAAAEHAIEAGHWETAVSRSYYAAYHAVVALLETKAGPQRASWQHVEVQIAFRQRFTNRGFLFSAHHAASLEDLYQARLWADYERAPTTGRHAHSLMRYALELVQRVGEVNGDDRSRQVGQKDNCRC
jgi:uncharacterized protein (UPF0332 family)